MNKNELPEIAVVRLSNQLLAGEKQFYKHWSFKWNNDEFSAIEPIRPIGPGFSWILCSDGRFIKLIELSRKPRTPSFLKSFINFTRIHYQTEVQPHITLGELEFSAKGTRGSIHKTIRKLVTDYSADYVLTERIFHNEILGNEVSYDEA